MKHPLVVVLPDAQADMDDTAEFIAQDNVDAARRFVVAAEASFRYLAEMPTIGPQRAFHHSNLLDLRSWRIRGFENWLVFYRPIPEGIEVIRVLHGARDLDDILESSP